MCAMLLGRGVMRWVCPGVLEVQGLLPKALSGLSP